MRLLIDTHVLLWWLGGQQLSTEAASAISAPFTSVFVSVASAWEIAIKRALGRVTAPPNLEHQLSFHRFEPIPVELRHALLAADLPLHHKDPFDRMLVAQAISDNLTIVTRDPAIRRYDVRTMAA